METAARFLEIDRQAGLGKLGGGVVHALNNVLAAFLGQLDLLMFNPDAAPFREDFERMLTACDQGTELTRSLMMVTHSMQDGEASSADSLVTALLRILTRVFRRQEVHVENRIESTSYLEDTGDFAQAAFHMVLLGFLVESRVKGDNRKLTCTLNQKDNCIQLVIEVGSGSFEMSAAESLKMELPPESSDDDYHFWIIEKVCRADDSWSVSDDKSCLELRWNISQS